MAFLYQLVQTPGYEGRCYPISSNAFRNVAWINSVLGELSCKIYFSGCGSCQIVSASIESSREYRNFYSSIFPQYFFISSEYIPYFSAYLHFNTKLYLLMNNTFDFLQICFYSPIPDNKKTPSPISKTSQHPSNHSWNKGVLSLFHISSGRPQTFISWIINAQDKRETAFRFLLSSVC